MPLSRRAEIGLLVALCVFLPLYEAPKNLVWLAYALVWLFNRAQARDFGGRWDAWDTLIAAWVASGFVIAPFAGVHGSEWHAAFDIVRYGGALWMVKRSRLTEREIHWVLGALVASVLVGLVMAYAKLWGGDSLWLQLNSVGHVNHTAIYLALMLGVCASWLFSGERRVVAAAVTLLLLVSLFVTASRAAVGVALLTLLLLALAWWRRSRLPLAIAAGILVITTLVAVVGGAEVYEKHEALVQEGRTLAYREEVWRVALDTWRRYPWFGVGMDNFSRQVEESRRALYPHGHSLYFNTLAERGVIGAAPLAAVLIAWPLWLWRRRPAPGESAQAWTLWGGASSAWLVTVVVGGVNTTLHHEHGLLAALLLGLWLSRTGSRASDGR